MLLSGWRTRVLLACSSLPVAVETVYLRHAGEADDATLLCCLLSVTACLLMALLPRAGAWAIVALWVARCVMPGTTPLSILFCLLMAVTVMAYRDMRVALPAAIIAQAATAARIRLYPWDSSTFTMLCATAAFLLLALWLGSAMDRQERREAEERERAVLLRRMADQRLATQLHHSVANDLATILLLARQWSSGESDEERADGRDAALVAAEPRPSVANADADADGSGDENRTAADDSDDATAYRQTMELIERTASESLVKVRALIAGLDAPEDQHLADGGTVPGNDGSEGSPDGFFDNDNPRPTPAAMRTVPFPREPASEGGLAALTADDLHAVVSPYGERLHARGLDGSIVIGGVRSATCTAERRNVLFDILREIVGNMMKYADPEAGYCIAVTLATGLVTVSESNGVRSDDDTTHDTMTHDTMTHDGPGEPALGGGTGLDRCRRAATDLGGEYAASENDGTWIVLLRLPLT